METKTITEKKVRVRIKLGNTPYLGFVYLPDHKERVSDVLNSPEPYLPLTEVTSLEPVKQESLLLVNKKHISYIQALEEPAIKSNFDVSTVGIFVNVKITMKDLNIKIVGKLFVLFKDGNIFYTVNKPTFFLNLKDVVIEGTNEKYTFLAVSKTFTKTIETDGTDIHL